jgi:hypothetical protein
LFKIAAILYFFEVSLLYFFEIYKESNGDFRYIGRIMSLFLKMILLCAYVFKGTVRPDWICMRVVPLESPLKGHQPLYVFDFLISVLNI